MWNAIFFAATAFVCVLCAAVSLFGARNAFRASALLAEKITSIESRVQSIITSHTAWAEVTEDLARTVKMQKVRRGISASGSKDGEPDPKIDPEAWRAWMNAKLRAGQFNA